MRIVVDTGPLVALLNRRDRHHGWIRQVLDAVEPPMLTCEAIVSEACFLLSRLTGGQDALMALLANDVLKVDFQLNAERDAIRALMCKYASVPMSLADACLVRMSELDSQTTIVTLDGNFRVYRRDRRQVIPAIMPSRGG